MIGLVTAEARTTMEKGRRKREREERARMMPASDAHHVAEGAAGHVTGEAGDGEPVMEPAVSAKGYQDYGDIGVHDGPGDPVPPGMISPHEFNRPYIGAGHAAPSPGYAPPNTPHVDMRGDRGSLQTLSPHAPMPVDGPR